MANLSLGVWLAAAAGLVAGAAINWAAYALAWNRRAVSPWSAPDASAPPRRGRDRLPILGWLGLRREAALHGRLFWLRPLLVELLTPVALGALYWWEVDRQGLIAGQLNALAAAGQLAGDWSAPWSARLATFLSHAILATLMAAASLVDLDEKTIPSAITDVGTLVGLALAAAWPISLPPHVAIGVAASPAAVALSTGPGAVAAGQLVLEPTTIAAPLPWPAWLDGVAGLALGEACFLLWCFALTPRIWRTSRGAAFGLTVLLARVRRELGRPPLAWVALAGAAAIVGVWVVGGASWVGLLTALVGMIGASAMVWAVRVVAAAALGREAMGFGDVTLMMMIGAFLGWQIGVVAFFLAPLAALVVGVLQLVLRQDDEIPYGPFLCLATTALGVGWARWWHVPPGGLQLAFELGGPWIIAILAGCILLLGAMLAVWQRVKEAVRAKEA